MNSSNINVPSSITLAEGEKPIWYGRATFKAFLGAIIFALILLIVGFSAIGIPYIGYLIGIGPIILGLLILLMVYLAVRTSEYFISNKRVFIKHGIIGRSTHDLKAEWITGSTLHQGFLGRMLNYGSIMFTGPGITGNVQMTAVADPAQVRNIVDNMITNNKKRKELEDKINRLKEEYDFGRIDEAKYKQLLQNYQEELNKL